MISVCIATYNGAGFIVRQLNSVLSQLSEQDQVVVVDDCSKDDTVQVIKDTYGNRVEVYVNERNAGVIKSFEKAISKARGDIIFLCDQDDMWLANKVETVVNEFRATNASVVVHDAYVTDGDGEIIHESWNVHNNNREKGLIGNIVKNSFTGCCMAFKKEIVRDIIPFPKSIEMHDQWIALVCMMSKRKIAYIRKPLMKYVRHGGNVTGMRKRSFNEQLKGRIGTIKAVMQYKATH
jgi:glycosyltransferase involved in cell wall biosynthesis